jgi:hypothetical protein
VEADISLKKGWLLVPRLKELSDEALTDPEALNPICEK